MLKTLRFALMSAFIVLMASCKDMTLTENAFTVTPQILTEVGGQVPVTIDGVFPEKYFQKKAIVTVTPILKWDGGSATGEPMTFQGEKIKGNNIVVKKKDGYPFYIKFSFPYQPEMIKSELYVTFDATVKGKIVEIPALKIADGVISTEDLYRSTAANAKSAMSQDEYQRIVKDAQTANIMFAIQEANIRASETNSDQMETLKEYFKLFAEDTRNFNVDNLEISAYASPDGGTDLNERLAGQREQNAMNFIQKEMKKSKLNTDIDSKYTAQDWDGFKTLIEKSNLQDKDLILRILSMYEDPERREVEIKNLSSVYGELADQILPQLRRARLTLNYQVIGRSDEEIQYTLKHDPRSLSCNELLYAANLADKTADKKNIYTSTTQIYPSDYRAFNNLGVLAFQDGDYEKAHQLYHKAMEFNSSAPEIHTNLSNMLLAQGKLAEAQNHLAKGGDSPANKQAVGISYIAQGQYLRAVDNLKDSNTESEALAYILNKDYTNARRTLNSIENPSAITYYLNAVLAARTNAANVGDYLKKAVEADPSLKERAEKDLEFARYQNVIESL